MTTTQRYSPLRSWPGHIHARRVLLWGQMLVLCVVVGACDSGGDVGLRPFVNAAGPLGATIETCTTLFPTAVERDGVECARLASDLAEADASAWLQAVVADSEVKIDEAVCMPESVSPPTCAFFGSSEQWGPEVMTVTYVREDLRDPSSGYWFNIMVQPSSMSPAEFKEKMELLYGS